MKKTDLTWNEVNRQEIQRLEAIFFKNADTLSYQLPKKFPFLKGIFNFFGLKTELEKETDRSVIQQKLKNNNIELHKLDSRGVTPLIVAVQENNIELMKSLIQLEVDVNKSDVNGKTALHWAATNGNPEITELLIKNGGNVNVKDLSVAQAVDYAKAKDKREKIKLGSVKIRKTRNKKTVDILKEHKTNHVEQETHRKKTVQKQR